MKTVSQKDTRALEKQYHFLWGATMINGVKTIRIYDYFIMIDIAIPHHHNTFHPICGCVSVSIFKCKLQQSPNYNLFTAIMKLEPKFLHAIKKTAVATAEKIQRILAKEP